MNDNYQKLLVHRSPWENDVEFLLQRGDSIAAPILMEKIEQGAYKRPSFSLSPEATQELMDGLWAVGFRPTEGSGSAGALKATEMHLDDMRTLVFEALVPLIPKVVE